MPMHWGYKKLGIISTGSSVATTIPRASGVALASKVMNKSAVTIVYFGDGSAFAAAHRLPVVFFCNNNGWAPLCRLASRTPSLGSLRGPRATDSQVSLLMAWTLWRYI